MLHLGRRRTGMTGIDERLIDPEPAQLAQLLERAARRANHRLHERRVEKSLFDWHQFVRRQRKLPQGRRVYRGGRGGTPAAVVQAAWWTDCAGRRHWRVTGRRFDWMDQ